MSANKAMVKVPGKAPTGIAGFDEITGGGLPRGFIDALPLPDLVQAGPRNRGLSIVKSRGTAHSNQAGDSAAQVSTP